MGLLPVKGQPPVYYSHFPVGGQVWIPRDFLRGRGVRVTRVEDDAAVGEFVRWRRVVSGDATVFD